MSAPAVAVSTDGKTLAAAWKDVRDERPRVWWASGPSAKLPAEVSVGPPRDVLQDHPSLALGDGGVFWLAWEEGVGAARRLRCNLSAPKATPREVADMSQGAPAFPVIACGAGLAIVAWESASADAGERVFARVIDDARR